MDEILNNALRTRRGSCVYLGGVEVEKKVMRMRKVCLSQNAEGELDQENGNGGCELATVIATVPKMPGRNNLKKGLS